MLFNQLNNNKSVVISSNITLVLLALVNIGSALIIMNFVNVFDSPLFSEHALENYSNL